MPRAWVAAIAGLEVACSRPAIPREITVVGSDYAFSVPDTLPPGPAVIHYRHNGAVAHEMIFGRLRAGGSPAEFADSLAHGGSVGRFVDGGTAVLLYASVGDQVDLSLAIDLKPGRNYVLLGTLTDGPRNTPHVRLGMFKGLVVRSP